MSEAIKLESSDVKDVAIELTEKGLKKAARAILLGVPLSLPVDRRQFAGQVKAHIDAVCASAAAQAGPT